MSGGRGRSRTRIPLPDLGIAACGDRPAAGVARRRRPLDQLACSAAENGKGLGPAPQPLPTPTVRSAAVQPVQPMPPGHPKVHLEHRQGPGGIGPHRRVVAVAHLPPEDGDGLQLGAHLDRHVGAVKVPAGQPRQPLGWWWVRVRRCRRPAAPALPSSASPVRPDGSRRPSCSPRATPRPRSPAPSACPARAPMPGMPPGSKAVWTPSAVGARLARIPSCQMLSSPGRGGVAGRAMANGFHTDLWTLERVAVVIT